jgi:hypothetical protein
MPNGADAEERQCRTSPIPDSANAGQRKMPNSANAEQRESLARAGFRPLHLK